MSTNENTMLIDGNDFISAMRIYESYKKILEYKLNYSQNSESDSEKTFDAMSFHVWQLGLEIHSVSKSFRKIYNEIDWEQLSFLVFGEQLGFPSEDVMEVLFNKEDGIDSSLEQFIQFEETLIEYINSKEFLFHKLTFKEYNNWIIKEGRLYLDIWVDSLNHHFETNIIPSKISKQKIIDAWKLLDKNKVLTERIIKVNENEIMDVKFPILYFRLAYEHILISLGILDYSDLPFFSVPDLQVTKSHSIQSKKKDLPWDTTYPYSTKTSNSIWTAKKK